jgi:phosphatidylethanolamine/phosphatidyl-N-methylethanolamine N-methyltransferase
MTSLSYSTTAKSLVAEENKLFFRQCLKSPIQLGAFVPTSLKLASVAASQLNITEKTTIVEIGARTGRLTRAILARGANIDRLAVVESDQTMSDFLKASLRDLYQLKTQPKIIRGNSEELAKLIPNSWIGKVDYVISTIPLTYMEDAIRERIIQSALDVLNPETGSIFHVSYSPVSPIRFMEGELLQKRVVSLWKNIPPGFVWRFTTKRYPYNFS